MDELRINYSISDVGKKWSHTTYSMEILCANMKITTWN